MLQYKEKWVSSHIRLVHLYHFSNRTCMCNCSVEFGRINENFKTSDLGQLYFFSQQIFFRKFINLWNDTDIIINFSIGLKVFIMCSHKSHFVLWLTFSDKSYFIEIGPFFTIWSDRDPLKNLSLRVSNQFNIIAQLKPSRALPCPA